MGQKIVITVEKTELGWRGSMRGKTDKGFTSPILTTGVFTRPDGAVANLNSKISNVEKWLEQIK